MGYNFKNKKIMVAEDEPMNYILIEKFLEQTNAIIFRALDGEDLIQKIEDHDDIDLILMDMSMPKLDGFEATRRLRDSGIQIPIIAQTALSGDDEKEEILKVGCNDYIEKPIIKDNLFKVIAKYL